MTSRQQYLIGLDFSASQNVYNLAEVESGRIVKTVEVPQGAFFQPDKGVDTRVLDDYRTDLPITERAHVFVSEGIGSFLERAREEGIDVRPEDVRGIGISLAGKVFANGRGGGEIYFLGANTPPRFGGELGGGQYAINVSKTLREEFLGVPIVGGNDCNCTGNAQAFVYERMGYDPRKTFYMTISTGIGGGGPVDDVDEVGHYFIENVHPAMQVQCGCGVVGCLEAYASGTGIAKLAKHLVGLHKGGRSTFDSLAEYERLAGRTDDLGGMVSESPLTKMLSSGSDVTSKTVVDFARAGDGFSQFLLESTARMTAGVIINIAQTHDLEVVGVGGGVGENNPDYVARIHAYVRERLTGSNLLPRGVRVEVGPLGTVANNYGALSLVVPEEYRGRWAETMQAEAEKMRETLGNPHRLSVDAPKAPRQGRRIRN
jgi:glucokinase